MCSATGIRCARAWGWRITPDHVKRKLAIITGVILALILATMLMDRLLDSQSKHAVNDDRDLIPVRHEVLAESNGFALLIQAGKALAVAGNDPLFTWTNWDAGRARDLLDANQMAMADLHQTWSLPELQVETVTHLTQDFSYLMNWRKLAGLAIVEAHLSFENGDQAKGFSQALEVVRFGQRIEEAGGMHLHHLVGATIKYLGVACINHFTDTTSLSASNLLSINRQLKQFEADQDALRQMLLLDYQINAKSFDEIASSPAADITTRLFFSADKSKRAFADNVHYTMQALTNYYCTGIMMIPEVQTNEWIVTRVLQGNFVGRELTDMDLSTRGYTLIAKCRENVWVRMSRTILALRAFQMTHHRPASSLAELVPDFLEAVPVDDFDGKPLRYAPALKEVYSVGVCLVDGGGIKSTNSGGDGNIIFKYNF